MCVVVKNRFCAIADNFVIDVYFWVYERLINHICDENCVLAIGGNIFNLEIERLMLVFDRFFQYLLKFI